MLCAGTITYKRDTSSELQADSTIHLAHFIHVQLDVSVVISAYAYRVDSSEGDRCNVRVQIAVCGSTSGYDGEHSNFNTSTVRQN